MILKRLHLRLGKKAMEKLMKPLEPPWKAAACAGGGYLEPFVLLEPPAHNTGCCVMGLTYSPGTFVSFFVFTTGCKASAPPCFAPSLEPLEYTAESRDRTGSQHDIQCSERCGRSRTEARRWGHVAANCRVCIVSRNLQSCHTPLGSAA